MKNIVILGSTGSIGQNVLKVLEDSSGEFRIWGLSCHSNIQKLITQIKKFSPLFAVVSDSKAYAALRKLSFPNTNILEGEKGLEEITSASEVDVVLNALVGSSGMLPSLKTVQSGKTLLLANKESLVMAGELITKTARENRAEILPIDSEHSALKQCLMSGKKEEIRNLILTASGGPFLKTPLKDFKKITVKQALTHPIWKMGKKITIDSATLMNKGLEIIEAFWLFDISAEKIKVLIHPQSVIHSMVEYQDGSYIAQLSVPDMKISISYALFYPQRMPGQDGSLDFVRLKNLTFENPDLKRFPCLSLAYQALKEGGSFPAVLNSANEIAVRSFLESRIPFLKIPKIIEKTLERHQQVINPSLEEILEAKSWAEHCAYSLTGER